MKLTGYDKAIICVGLFFLALALMGCTTYSQGSGYIARDKEFTTKNLYEEFMRQGIIK